jgi:hypothetical protein
MQCPSRVGTELSAKSAIRNRWGGSGTQIRSSTVPSKAAADSSCRWAHPLILEVQGGYDSRSPGWPRPAHLGVRSGEVETSPISVEMLGIHVGFADNRARPVTSSPIVYGT